jgi:peptidase M23-like protein
MAGVKKRLVVPPFLLSLALAAGAGSGTPSSDAAKPVFPLDEPAGLVASFGEYRPDHLHPGVDFSTRGRDGLPVHAVEAGRIYRLKVEWRGYGRALYIRHADGRISVYAHLERYEDSHLGLEKLVSREKEKRGVRYPGDIQLEPPIPVRRGEVVGYSGESGAGLPHLHFEMRRDDQEPADPLVPGWISGSAPPVFESVLFVSDSPETWIDGKRVLEMELSRGEGGVYAPGRVPVLSGRFLPEARVHSGDREGHRLGIKALTVLLDGVTIYRFRLDSFRFAQYPEVGLLLDHARSRLSPPDYSYFLVRLPGNDLGGPGKEEAPWPPLPPGEHRLEVEAQSALGDVARARVPFRTVAPVRLAWDEAAAGSSPQTIRFGAQRSDLGPGVRVVYRAVGSGAPVPCVDPETLPDGERCRLQAPTGASGITAELLQGAALRGRSTRFFPAEAPGASEAPAFSLEPFRRFVDIHIHPGDGKTPPARLVLGAEGKTSRIELAETAPGEYLGTIPVEEWSRSSSLGVEWEVKEGESSPVRLPVAARMGEPGSGLKFEDCGVRFEIEPGSFYAGTPVQCENPDSAPPPQQEMALLGRPVRLLPDGTPLARKGILSFSLPSDPHPERAGIYLLDPSRSAWMFQGGELGEGRIRLGVGRLATFALLRDDSPPRILGVEPSGSGGVDSRRPLFRVRVEDRGSGLNFDGVHLSLDGIEMESEFDPDRGWSSAVPAGPLSAGVHAGSVWAVDRAGNRSAPVAFQVRVR